MVYLIIWVITHVPPNLRVQTATSQVETPMTRHYSPEGGAAHDGGDEHLETVGDIGQHGFSDEAYHNNLDDAEDHQPQVEETLVDAPDCPPNPPSKSLEVDAPGCDPKPTAPVSSKAGGPAPEALVATPCRNAQTVGGASPGSTDLGTPSSMGSIGDKSEETPIPGELRLSENAINLRLHRVMKLDSKGSSRVSDEIRKQFHCKKGKLRLQQIFQSCGFNPDRCDKKLGWFYENPNPVVFKAKIYCLGLPVVVYHGYSWFL